MQETYIKNIVNIEALKTLQFSLYCFESFWFLEVS